MVNKRPWEALDLLDVKSGCGRILAILLILLSVAGASTQSPRDVEIEKLLKKLNKLPIKTIESLDGEIIDCVDIYKQPAFDHPLLKNHTIEMRPSFVPEIVDKSNYSSEYVEPIWRWNESCPEGTIPIRRVRKSDILRVESLEGFGLVHPNPFRPTNVRIEVAIARMTNPPQLFYNGVGGDLSVWRPFVERVEATSSAVFIGYQGDAINAGWTVTHSLFGDDEPRSFVAWKSRQGGGCYNHVCPGFVQTNRAVVLGSPLPISTHGGPLSVRRFQIYKTSNHKWWVMINGVEVGYYPPEIFHNFIMADTVEWGGSIVNTMNLGHHAITQMGSGRFAEERHGRAAHFENMVYLDHNSRYRPAHNFHLEVSFPRCYNAILSQRPTDSHPVLFYGGPGGMHCDRELTG